MWELERRESPMYPVHFFYAVSMPTPTVYVVLSVQYVVVKATTM